MGVSVGAVAGFVFGILEVNARFRKLDKNSSTDTAITTYQRDVATTLFALSFAAIGYLGEKAIEHAPKTTLTAASLLIISHCCHEPEVAHN